MRNRWLLYALNDIDLVETELKKDGSLCNYRTYSRCRWLGSRYNQFFSNIRKSVAQAHEVVLILDEVQSGLERKFFAISW
jgi:hypothetical protein